MENLINDLIKRTHTNLNQAEELNKLPTKVLQWRAYNDSWSSLECLEHLNRYGRFYIPEIKMRMQNAPTAKPGQTFKTGLVGNYFAKSMLPKEKLNKMKTFSNMNPINSKLEKGVIEEFIHQQRQLLQILDSCRQIDLNKTKTAISITKLIKLKLGDTLRVVIYHNQRHLVQAHKVLKEFEVHQNSTPTV
jgi:hypothetical protein